MNDHYSKELKTAVRAKLAEGNLSPDQLAVMTQGEFLQVIFPGMTLRQSLAVAGTDKVPSRSTLSLWSRDLPEYVTSPLSLRRLVVASGHLDILRAIRIDKKLSLPNARRMAIEMAADITLESEPVPLYTPAAMTRDVAGLYREHEKATDSLCSLRVEQRHLDILEKLADRYTWSKLSRAQTRRLAIEMAGLSRKLRS